MKCGMRTRAINRRIHESNRSETLVWNLGGVLRGKQITDHSDGIATTVAGERGEATAARRLSTAQHVTRSGDGGAPFTLPGHRHSHASVLFGQVGQRGRDRRGDEVSRPRRGSAASNGQEEYPRHGQPDGRRRKRIGRIYPKVSAAPSGTLHNLHGAVVGARRSTGI